MKQKQILALLQDMSLTEKIGQMVQMVGMLYDAKEQGIITGPMMADMKVTEEDLKMAGSSLLLYGGEKLARIQKSYMENQPHHIPQMFMYDVIHGMKTIFPVPLAQGASFDPVLARDCASVAAKEAAAGGIHVAFSPMVDLVRDPRWGRVMESTGEDPYLNGLFAEAMVQGLQGDDMSREGKVCACVKHFAGYGGATGGRDYNTVEVSENSFRNEYLPAYEKGIKAGAGMVMTSFNTVNGVPATINQWLMKKVLREEMGFDGVLISDFAAIYETIAHGCSEDAKDAAHKAALAGVDIDMMTECYRSELVRLVEDGTIPEALIDESVLRILTLKNKLGLFEDPYKGMGAEKEAQMQLTEAHRALARKAAAQTFVLLKNEGGLLPLSTEKKIAFIGPYTDSKCLISTWAISGDVKDCVTIREAAEEVFDSTKTTYVQGSAFMPQGYVFEGFDQAGNVLPVEYTEAERTQMLQEAIEAAKQAEIVVMPIGEYYLQSGEATSRGDIRIPEPQLVLLREVAKVNANIVVVLFNGRPLDLREVEENAKAVLEVWLPGTEGGHAIVDALTGKVNPSGKLPMSFPYCVGQIPIYYNHLATGRPNDPQKKERYLSKYLDIPNEPLYPFGYGLSYTGFTISDVILSSDRLTENGEITASVCIQNTGVREGSDVLQLYIRDVTASVARPVKELKGIEKVSLKPGEKKEISFRITEEMLRFVRADGSYGSEPGKFRVWISDSSDSGVYQEFIL